MAQKTYQSIAFYAVGVARRILGVSGHGFTDKLVSDCNAKPGRDWPDPAEDVAADTERAALQVSLATG